MKHIVPPRRFLLCLTGFALLAAASAQRFRGGSSGGSDSVHTAREVESHSTGTPNWTNAAPFQRDVFTFARVRYSSGGGGRGGRMSRGFGGYYGGGGRWATDFPDSDLNLSYRLQQMTSMKVNPDGRVVDLMDKELASYPWIYIVEPGGLLFTDEEVVVLRKYLLNGGFLMVDDFWGDSEWENFYREIRRVFPDREPQELPLDHPLYSCVFPIKAKYQVPNIRVGEQSQHTGVTWETNHDGDVRTVHHRCIFDDKGRLMVFIAHNTDNGDGWEREGENEYYFREFSEKVSYPLGINVIFYAMTH